MEEEVLVVVEVVVTLSRSKQCGGGLHSGLGSYKATEMLLC